MTQNFIDDVLPLFSFVLRAKNRYRMALGILRPEFFFFPVGIFDNYLASGA